VDRSRTDDRVAEHVAAFNEAVRSGDWRSFVTRFDENAQMYFTGVPFGPVKGREAIAESYRKQPPTDTLIVVDSRIEDDVDQRTRAAHPTVNNDVDVVRFRWSAGGTGTMRLTWNGSLVAVLEISFDG